MFLDVFFGDLCGVDFYYDWYVICVVLLFVVEIFGYVSLRRERRFEDGVDDFVGVFVVGEGGDVWV